MLTSLFLLQTYPVLTQSISKLESPETHDKFKLRHVWSGNNSNHTFNEKMPSFSLKESTLNQIKQQLESFGSPYFAGFIKDDEEEYQEFIDRFNQDESKVADIIFSILEKDETELLLAIQQLKENGGILTHLMIDNAPLAAADEFETPLPYGTSEMSQKNPIAEWFMIGIANILGKPMGYINEKNAQLVHNVSPDPTKKQSLSSAGFKEDLPHHIEVYALKTRPDFLLLGSARADRDNHAETSIYPVDAALSHLTQEEIDILAQQRFSHQMSPSFGNYDSVGKKSSSPQSVLFKSTEGKFRAALHGAFTESFDEGDELAQRALEHLNESIRSEKVGVKLQPGNMLKFSNAYVLH